MQDCVQRIIASLRDQNLPDIGERLLEATLLIEKSCGLSGYEGISPAVDSAAFTPEDITKLRTSLMEFAQANRDHPNVGSALFALGRFQDDSLRSFLLGEMKHHFQSRHLHAVEQADCALGNLGDEVDFDHGPGIKSDDEYFEAVRLYLEKQAIE